MSQVNNQASAPPLSLGQFYRQTDATGSAARLRFLAHAAVNREGGQGIQGQLAAEANNPLLHAAIRTNLAKRKA